jgi:hypothetical protein
VPPEPPEPLVPRFPGGAINEVFSTGNFIDRAVSDSTADVGKVINLEGHFLGSTFGLDFLTQSFVCNGHTPVDLDTPGYRANRVSVADGTFEAPSEDLVGNLYIYASTETTGVSSGVPGTASAVKVMINAGKNQSEKCATSLSRRDYWVIAGLYAAINRGSGQGISGEVEIEYRRQGGVWLPLGMEAQLVEGAPPGLPIPLNPYAIIPANSDVRMVGLAEGSSAIISARIHGYLALDRSAT